ncbi:hypothetical protein G5V59_19980 [Nocardioides sp. W3-2-3]|uniref:hypothetical protein n=1 Tax=Nocardioides convexus TaxID=2712224 RepID=UPI0024183B23|nr:hypothetical protein [Nocardioides convexus]NHA01345.1 hypothetical protein [Nocardioides convexus]
MHRRQAGEVGFTERPCGKTDEFGGGGRDAPASGWSCQVELRWVVASEPHEGAWSLGGGESTEQSHQEPLVTLGVGNAVREDAEPDGGRDACLEESLVVLLDEGGWCFDSSMGQHRPPWLPWVDECSPSVLWGAASSEQELEHECFTGEQTSG